MKQWRKKKMNNQENTLIIKDIDTLKQSVADLQKELSNHIILTINTIEDKNEKIKIHKTKHEIIDLHKKINARTVKGTYYT